MFATLKSMSSNAGSFVTEKLDYDGGRDVTVYVPARSPQAIVFAGDGNMISQWGSDLEAENALPVMIVGVDRAKDETRRLHEYTPVFDAERFASHEEFFVQDVRQWIASRFAVQLSPERTAVCGVSAGGELALAMGMRHPDIFGVVLCASPGGGFQPPEIMPTSSPRVYLVAGTKEPFFLANAQRWADALHDGGEDVVMVERNGCHGGVFWREEFPNMLTWAFGGFKPS